LDIFPERGSGLQPRVAVLGYPGKDGGEFPNPTGVVAESPAYPIGSVCLESLSEFMALST
jgi:hypothetical protein